MQSHSSCFQLGRYQPVTSFPCPQCVILCLYFQLKLLLFQSFRLSVQLFFVLFQLFCYYFISFQYFQLLCYYFIFISIVRIYRFLIAKYWLCYLNFFISISKTHTVPKKFETQQTSSSIPVMCLFVLMLFPSFKLCCDSFAFLEHFVQNIFSFSWVAFYPTYMTLSHAFPMFIFLQYQLSHKKICQVILA